MIQTPAGWYADPDRAAAGGSLRYWDGTAWTSHVAPAPAAPAPTGPTTPDGEQLAGWWWRVLALMIDSIIVSVVAGIISLPAQIQVQRDFQPVLEEFDRELAQNPESVDFGGLFSDYIDVLQDHALWLMGPSIVLTALYWAVFLRWKRATPGKLMLGMRIRLRDQAASLPWSSILARLLVQFGITWAAVTVALVTGSIGLFVLAGLVGVLMLIDPLWAAWDPKRQALHDKLAGTSVVRQP